MSFGKTILKFEFVELIRCCEESIYYHHIKVKTGFFHLDKTIILVQCGNIIISYLK